jgi:hypothetical protein
MRLAFGEPLRLAGLVLDLGDSCRLADDLFGLREAGRVVEPGRRCAGGGVLGLDGVQVSGRVGELDLVAGVADLDSAAASTSCGGE